jgi:carboxypeptidase Q
MTPMNTKRLSRNVLAVALAVAMAAFVVPSLAGQSQEPVDLQAIYKIKEEGLQRSKVMEITSYLTDVYGPRLTGSPGIRTAGEWAVKEMQSWGLANAKLEPWGPFGRGWTNDRFVGHMLAPSVAPLIGYPKAWTPGTSGPVKAEAVLAVLNNDRDLDTYRGQLKGKFVLTMPARPVAAHFEPEGHRYTDAELEALARQPIAPPRGRGGAPGGGPGADPGFATRRTAFLVSEGVAATLEAGRGDGGTTFVQSGGSRNAQDPPTVPQIVLAVEHYNRIVRVLEKNIPVTLELDVRNTFHDADLNAFNVVAEIPGADKADELVMVGAHFDSWHSATGATDNAAGSAVMMETMRILKASGLRLRRTVRIALWTGEEEGLLGSRAYVDEHFANRQTMETRPAHAKLAGYFNVDNGTGAIRGVYLQGNETIAPIFKAWMAPFQNLRMSTLTIRNTGGTDHLSFDAVGLPGFQFIQDPIEYDARTHHSNMDVYDRIQEADMMQNAVIVAAFVYQAANRDAMLPRKPMPRAPPRPTTAQQGR